MKSVKSFFVIQGVGSRIKSEMTGDEGGSDVCRLWWIIYVCKFMGGVMLEKPSAQLMGRSLLTGNQGNYM
jgi:hypothetical protein